MFVYVFVATLMFLLFFVTSRAHISIFSDYIFNSKQKNRLLKGQNFFEFLFATRYKSKMDIIWYFWMYYNIVIYGLTLIAFLLFYLFGGNTKILLEIYSFGVGAIPMYVLFFENIKSSKICDTKALKKRYSRKNY